MTEETSGFSYLSDTEERLYIFATFFLAPILLFIAAIILFALKKEISAGNINNPYTRKSLKCATFSVFCSVLMYIEFIFFMNDLITPLNFKMNQHYSIITDAILVAIYLVGLVAFYYSFTFHVQSILYEFDQTQQMSLFLKIWMILVGILVLFFGALYIIDDASAYSSRETGFTEKRNIYLSMYSSHEGARYAHIIPLILLAVDAIYFFVLIYIYISRLKSLKSWNDEGIKGVVLVSFACIIYWIHTVSVSFNLNIKWITIMTDIGSDDLCLYFMIITSSKQLYYSLFGVFHSCFGKLIYGSNNYEIVPTQNEDEDFL